MSRFSGRGPRATLDAELAQAFGLDGIDPAVAPTPVGIMPFERRADRGARLPGIGRRVARDDAVDADLDDGTTLSLVMKDLGRDALTEVARRVKPAFLHDPMREIEAYQSVLPAAPAGPRITRP